jgi:methyl-accepting chemotaxis protein
MGAKGVKRPRSWFLALLLVDALCSVSALACGPACPWVSLVGACSMAATILYYWRFIARPLRKFVQLQRRLIDEEARPLIFDIAELANGTMNERSERPPVDEACPGAFETAPLPELLSTLSKLLNEGALDYRSITSASCNRLCYVGADSFLEGKKCADKMSELLGGRGDIVVMLGSLNVTGHYLRYKGFRIGLAGKGSGCEIKEVVEEREDQELVVQKTQEIVRKYPDLKGIYVCEGTSAASIARVLYQKGLQGRVKILSHDLAEATMKAIIAGDIAASLSQSPYSQGYNPIIYLYNFLVTGERPAVERMLTGMGVVTAGNYRQFWDPGRGVVVSQEEMDSLVRPVERKGKDAIRIAVILPDDATFWKLVAEGARAAAASLAVLHVEVECVIPQAFRRRDWSVAAFKPVVESLIEQGFQAISLPVFDRELVDFLNEKIERGLVVATYNAEPVSFRGMVQAAAMHDRQR